MSAKKNDMNSEFQYEQIYTRNWPIITFEQQKLLQNLKIGVAGCGSTGGSFIEGAIRTGISYFHLSDNGQYETSNMNRQMITIRDLNKNKSEYYQEKILLINPNAYSKIWTTGTNLKNIHEFIDKLDFVFDAIDVTTKEGFQNKLLLHEVCAHKGIPVGSALDLGFCQWIKGYNYHKSNIPLEGKLEITKKTNNPLKALLTGFIPIDDLPLEASDEIIRLLTNTNSNACQLSSACFLLSSIVTPYFLNFIEKKELKPLISLDIKTIFENKSEKIKRIIKTKKSHKQLKNILKNIE